MEVKSEKRSITIKPTETEMAQREEAQYQKIREKFKSFLGRKTFLGVSRGVLLLMLGGYVVLVAGLYLTLKPAAGSDVLGSSTTAATQIKSEQILAKLATIYLVPKEIPVIAAVGNVEQLQKQYGLFFADAQVGDTLLIFRENKQAVLYRYRENKIIRVAPFVEQTPIVSPKPQ